MFGDTLKQLRTSKKMSQKELAERINIAKSVISFYESVPPTQCVKLRQNKRPLGRRSTSVRMVDPVVVKPETVSKKASISEGI